MARAPQRIPLFHFDPGWLFLIAGLAVLASTVLIPAIEDLEEARWTRDRALAIEEHRLDRLTNYSSYLEAVNRGDEQVIRSLIAKQLHLVPEGYMVVDPVDDPGHLSASVFPSLEPGELRIPPRVKTESTLAKLATGERSRLWMIVGGGVCVLIGLLPATRGSGT